MVPRIQTCLLLLSVHLVSIYCYDKPQVSSLKPIEPSWESTERLANERPLSVISERYLKSLESGKPKLAQSNSQGAHSASFQPLQSSLQEEVALSAASEQKNGQQEPRKERLLFDSLPSFTFAPLQAIVSGINSLVQPLASPVAEIGLGNIFPDITTVYSTYYSSGTQTVTQSFVSTKNTYWTTTTTSVSVTLSSTSTSTTTPVSVSVTTYPSTALLTSSSTASSTTTVTGTYTSTSTGTSTSTSTSTTTAQTTYSSTEVQVSTTTLPTQTSVSTTTATTTLFTVTRTIFITNTDTTRVTIATCIF